MAKGPFILHGASKKIGNMVVYKNPNSNNADTTVAREYVAEVKNPKTRQQAIQRMRMLPAQLFYRAFRELLDHSWQGIKYGGRSYAHFMKVALADKTITIPFLLKGTTDFVPGEYPVSQGSLAPLAVVGEFEEASGAVFNIDMTNYPSGGDPTVKDFSEHLISNNEGFKEGDFLTFVYVLRSGETFTPGFFRIQLSETNMNLMDEYPIKISMTTEGHQLSVYGWPQKNTVSAIAIIHSRKPAEGSTVWQRSNAIMAVADDAISNYVTTDAEEAAIASYQSNAGNVNAHWYLNGGAQ